MQSEVRFYSNDYGVNWAELPCGHKVNMDWLKGQHSSRPERAPYNCQTCGERLPDEVLEKIK